MKKTLTMALAMALAGGSVMGQAYEQGDWILRAGATTVAPDTKSDDINLPGWRWWRKRRSITTHNWASCPRTC